MPLIKLGFKPGVNRDRTNYSQEGGWWASDKIRFRQGFPEKIGGWEVETFDQYEGQARSLFTYVTLDGSILITIGTHKKIYVNAGTTLYDITPIRSTRTTPDTDNCFATTNASTTVTVSITGHGASTGDYVTFTGATATGGVPAGELNAEHEITVVDSNTFTFTVTLISTAIGLMFSWINLFVEYIIHGMVFSEAWYAVLPTGFWIFLYVITPFIGFLLLTLSLHLLNRMAIYHSRLIQFVAKS